MNNIVILISILVGILLLNKKLNVFFFTCVLFLTYFTYIIVYKKEHFLFDKNQSILKINDVINDFDDNNIKSLDEYEKLYNVTVKKDKDSINIVPNITTTSINNIQEINKIPKYVIYGTKILLQCNAMDNRYLSGNRDGYNPNNIDYENREGVYTTNDKKTLLEWFILPINNNLMGKKVKIGDKVILICEQSFTNRNRNTVIRKCLIGEQKLKAIPYNSSEDLCGVYTRDESKLPNNYKNHIWYILDNKKLIDNKESYLKYDDKIYLKLNTKFLSGARQYGYKKYYSNQQVYTVGDDDLDKELLWIIKDKKENRKFDRNNFKSWPLQNSLIDSAVSKLSDNNLFVKYSDKSDNTVSDNISIQNNIIIFNKTYDESSNCIENNNYFLIDFQREMYVLNAMLQTSLHPTNKVQVAIKTASEDGIFTDLNHVIELKYNYIWKIHNAKIAIKTINNEYANIDINKNITFNSIPDVNDINLVDHKDSIFIIKVHNQTEFSIIKQIDELFYILVQDKTTSLEEYDPTNIPVNAIFSVYYKDKITTNYYIKNNNNNYLFNISIEIQLLKQLITNRYLKQSLEIYETNNNLFWFYIYIGKNVRYLKFYPIFLNNNKNCDFKLKFSNFNIQTGKIKKIEFNKPNNIVTNNDTIKDTDNKIDKYLLSKLNPDIYNEVYKNNKQGNREIILQLSEPKNIKGGYLINRSSLINYVTKFDVLISDNNKFYEKIGTYTYDGEVNKSVQFNIHKKCKYVKVVILDCNNKCSFKLDIF